MAKDVIYDNCDVMCSRTPYHTFQNSNGLLNQNNNGTYVYCANNSYVNITIPQNSIIQGFYRYEDNVYISNKFKPTYIRQGAGGLKLTGNENQVFSGTADKTSPITIATGTISQSCTARVTDVVNGGYIDVTGIININVSDMGTNGATWQVTGASGTMGADYIDPITGETIPVAYSPLFSSISSSFTTLSSVTIGLVTTYSISGNVSFALDITSSSIVDIFIQDDNTGIFNEIEYNINNVYQFESDPQGIKSLMEIMKGCNQLNFISCAVLKSAPASNGTKNQTRTITIRNNTSTPYYVALVYQDYTWLFR
jgi:hypothetical protein